MAKKEGGLCTPPLRGRFSDLRNPLLSNDFQSGGYPHQWVACPYSRETTMITNNKNKKEKIIMNFNNNIFRTENVKMASGRVITHIVKVETGKRICFVDNQADLDWTISELMKQRLG